MWVRGPCTVGNGALAGGLLGLTRGYKQAQWVRGKRARMPAHVCIGCLHARMTHPPNPLPRPASPPFTPSPHPPATPMPPTLTHPAPPPPARPQGVFLSCQAAARQMAAQRQADPSWGGGAIITMSSVNALMAIPTIAGYNASKVRQGAGSSTPPPPARWRTWRGMVGMYALATVLVRTVLVVRGAMQAQRTALWL